MKFEIHHADVREWAKRYEGTPHMALCCDPPYELGFMGRSWDSTGIAFQPETWAAFLPHLLPGAFGFAFASSRGVHRMACAIEDAGFRLHPTIFCWANGASFPKATRVPDGRFDGHRYGGQALKGSVEPIVCFQKPYAGRPVDSIVAIGAGTLNIDAARIGVAAKKWETPRGGICAPDSAARAELVDNTLGRWPANFCLDSESSRLLDAQSGVLRNGGQNATSGERAEMFGERRSGVAASNHAGDSGGASRFFFTSDWNAEVEEALANAEPVRYVPKVSSSEREAGCEHIGRQNWMDGHTAPIPQRDERDSPGSGNHHPCLKPLALVSWLAKLLLPPVEYAPRRLLIPFSGVMSEAIGAALSGWEHITGIEQDAEYIKIGQARIRHHLGMLADVQVLETPND